MRWLAALLIGLLFSASASAQETRAAVLERERAEKAKQLTPYQPDKLETFVRNAEEGKLRRMLDPHNGFFVSYGYRHKVTGSGIGLGGGWRHDLFNRNARVILEAGMTLKSYQMISAEFFLPRLLDERLEVGVQSVWVRQPEDDFYGLGPDTPEANRSNYMYRGTDVHGRVVFKPRDWLQTGLRIGVQSPSIRTGKDEGFPSTELMFDETTAPGLTAQPDFGYADLFADVDFRDERGNPRDGGYYTFLARQYNDQDLGRYSFRQIDLEGQHYFPLFDKKRVFALRARLNTTAADDGHEVPFYWQPTVGGSKTLRSVDDFRFQDRNALLLNIEYRWEAFGAMDMALFSDWGKVAPRAEDLDVTDMKHAYGIGFRFKTASAVFFRFDIAAGQGEGVQYHFKFSNVF